MNYEYGITITNAIDFTKVSQLPTPKQLYVSKLTIEQEKEYVTWRKKIEKEVHDNPTVITSSQKKIFAELYTYDEIQRIAGNPLYKNKPKK